MNKVYLDYAATSPVHPLVVEKMAIVLSETFGNPSSIHSFGCKSRHLMDISRSVIASSINAELSEMVFTSGGTEANNLAITGQPIQNAQRTCFCNPSFTVSYCYITQKQIIIKFLDHIASQVHQPQHGTDSGQKQKLEKN